MMRSRCQGFSLIELVIVIVILSVAASALLGLFSQASLSVINNERLQIATQLAQAGAEKVLAQRRAQGFAAVATGTTNEALAGNFTGYTRTTDIVSPPASGGCPTVVAPAVAPDCKGVTVTVTNGGTSLAAVDLVLVDY